MFNFFNKIIIKLRNILTISLSGSEIGIGTFFGALFLGIFYNPSTARLIDFYNYIISISGYIINMDTPNIFQIFFQDSASPVMEGIIDLHNDITVFLILTLVIVFYIIFLLFLDLKYFFKLFNLYNFNFSNLTKLLKLKKINTNFSNLLHRVENNNIFMNLNNKFYKMDKIKPVTHNISLEIIWTIIPTILLFIIAFPSFILLYSLDEVITPLFTLKIIGNQWYWTYEYSDTFPFLINYIKKYNIMDIKHLKNFNITYDSYMLTNLNIKNIKDNNLYYRLLEVDNRIYLPIKTHIRLTITSKDVLHSWAVPSLGIKLDACPGRLNQTSLFILRKSIFYGQCSELCGINHGFMPIVIKSLFFNEFKTFIFVNFFFKMFDGIFLKNIIK